MKNSILFLCLVLILDLSATIINIPADQSTIQAGIDVSVDSDTVLVQPGTYFENINYNGKNITVASLFLIFQDTTYISQTVIDGNQNGSVVAFQNDEDSTAVLTGFKITNGNAVEGGGGIQCFFAHPKLEYLIVCNNTAFDDGGGIHCYNSNAIINHITINNNNAIQGGGIHFWNSNSLITNLEIFYNDASGQGGGVFCSFYSNVEFNDVTINSNHASDEGGGIFIGQNSEMHLENVIIMNSDSYDKGGGIFCTESVLNISNTYISNNHVWVYSGGGIFCDESEMIISNSEISNNVTDFDGGGLAIANNSSAVLFNVVVADNEALCVYSCGGGIFCSNESSVIMSNMMIQNNNSDNGGGVTCEEFSEIEIFNSLLNNNFAHSQGGAIFLSTSNANIINSTIINNSVDLIYGFGGGIYCANYAEPVLINCINYFNQPEEIYCRDNLGLSTISVSYSDISGGENAIITNNNAIIHWLDGNIDEDPLFIGNGNHPFTLQNLSSCVNVGIPDTTGLNLPEYDLAGNPRVYGGRIDIGAYENQNIIVNTNDNLPQLITQMSNYPNPFNPSTTIEFSIPIYSIIEIHIINIKGQKIKTLTQNEFRKGFHSITWNGDNDFGKSVSSGVYYFRLNVNGKTEAVKKCLLLK